MENDSPKLNIVLFNTDSSDEGINAPDRYRCMGVILDTVIAENYPNLFILAQDKINGPKHNTFCEKLQQNHTSVRLKKEAGVYYDTKTNTHYDVEYVNELQRKEDAVGLEPGSVFTVSLLTACVLTPKAGVTTGKKILQVSWHGPCKVNRKQKWQPNPPKQDPETARRSCFARLIRFLERLKVQKGCDMVIVGGDFNLPAGTASEELGTIDVNGEVSASYTPTADRPDRDPIDYVVYWPRDGLHVTDISVVQPDFRREHGNRPFDHNIVLYRFDEIDSYSDLARQFRNMSVYENEE